MRHSIRRCGMTSIELGTMKISHTNHSIRMIDHSTTSNLCEYASRDLNATNRPRAIT